MLKIAVLFLSFSFLQFASAQASSPTLTNADIISMAKAGIGEQTIILTVQRGPTKLDTSPQALIALKKAGVSDQVLNAMLTATGSQSPSPAQPSQSAPNNSSDKHHSDAPVQNAEQLTPTLYKWADATGKVIVCTQIHYSLPCNVPINTYVIREGHVGSITSTGDFSEGYSSQQFPTRFLEYNGANVRQLQPSETDASILQIDESQFSQYNVATEVKKTFEAEKRAMELRSQEAEQKHEQSLLEQRRKQEELDRIAIANTPPTIATAPTGLTLRVLQSESVPYTQESRGSISTSCNIVGDANTTANANSFGGTTFGTATTNWNQRMNCNSRDTTIRWPHVLNAMFVQGSNGNSYIIACDRAWRWSKCVPLRVGDTFNARFTDKGIEVDAVGSKGKAEKPAYSILRSAVSR